MTAKEMFEKLDLKLSVDNYLMIEYVNKYDSSVIVFSKERKTYMMTHKCYDEISVEMHKAISKQIKELGWL